MFAKGVCFSLWMLSFARNPFRVEVTAPAWTSCAVLVVTSLIFNLGLERSDLQPGEVVN